MSPPSHLPPIPSILIYYRILNVSIVPCALEQDLVVYTLSAFCFLFFYWSIIALQCQFPLYNKVNQPYISSPSWTSLLLPSHPTIQVSTEHVFLYTWVFLSRAKPRGISICSRVLGLYLGPYAIGKKLSKAISHQGTLMDPPCKVLWQHHHLVLCLQPSWYSPFVVPSLQKVLFKYSPWFQLCYRVGRTVSWLMFVRK